MNKILQAGLVCCGLSWLLGGQGAKRETQTTEPIRGPIQAPQAPPPAKRKGFNPERLARLMGEHIHRCAICDAEFENELVDWLPLGLYLGGYVCPYCKKNYDKGIVYKDEEKK